MTGYEALALWLRRVVQAHLAEDAEKASASQADAPAAKTDAPKP